MKKLEGKNLSSYTLIIPIGLLVLCLQSCARKIAFLNSSIVPAAEGSVKVKKDDNNNHKIDLRVIRLADPKRVDRRKDTYIVWMDTKTSGTKNIGRLKTSSGLFSKTLKSSLKTVTPFKPIRFFITAETNESIQYPGMQPVLETKYFNK